MTKYKEIKKQLEATREEIEKKKALVLSLDYTTERKAARENVQQWRELYEKATANAGKIDEVKKEIFVLEIERRILEENAKHALFVEAFPIIAAACKKYNGKPYGPKTAAAISEEVKKTGFCFYFDGYTSKSNVKITELIGGYTNPASYTATGAGYDEAGHAADFITKDNKIAVCDVIAKPRERYTENPKAAAKAAAEAIQKYQAAAEELENSRRALCALLPPTLPQPQPAKDYYLHF